MKISEVAALLGVSTDAVRFYEKKNIIHPGRNDNNRYRDFTQDDLTRLFDCKHLQNVGFSLSEIAEIITDTAPEDVSGMVSVVTDEARLFMPLAELVDLEAERARVRKSLEKARKDLAGQEAKLSNENFVSRAPEKVVNAEREKKAKLEALIENLEASLAALN